MVRPPPSYQQLSACATLAIGFFLKKLDHQRTYFIPPGITGNSRDISRHRRAIVISRALGTRHFYPVFFVVVKSDVRAVDRLSWTWEGGKILTAFRICNFYAISSEKP